MVYLRNVMHEPGLGIMAPGTILPDRAVVQIRVTIHTILPGLVKNQCCMAFPAVGIAVLTFQFKAGHVMTEEGLLRRKGPSIGGMAIRAIKLKFITMGILLKYQVHTDGQQDGYEWQLAHDISLNL
jgi:hypothetical protein